MPQPVRHAFQRRKNRILRHAHFYDLAFDLGAVRHIHLAADGHRITAHDGIRSDPHVAHDGDDRIAYFTKRHSVARDGHHCVADFSVRRGVTSNRHDCIAHVAIRRGIAADGHDGILHFAARFG